MESTQYDSAIEEPKAWQFRLYVFGMKEKSITLYESLRTHFETHLSDGYTIELIDLAREPHRGGEDRILATPTLDKVYPAPRKRVIGDLADTARVLTLMGLNDS